MRREQESKDDRERCSKPRPRPPPEGRTGSPKAGAAAKTVDAIARPGQRMGGGVLMPSTKRGLISRPHFKGNELLAWPEERSA
jgi:hypothetical protein